MKVRLFAVSSVTAVLFTIAGGPAGSDEAVPAMGAAPETQAAPDWYPPAPPNPAWSAGSWEPLPPVAPGQVQPAVSAEWYQLQAEFEANRVELYSVHQELQNTQALLQHAQAALERSYADYQQALGEQRLLHEQVAAAAAERDRAQSLAMQMKAELEAAKGTLAQNREEVASSQTRALSLTEEGAQLRGELTDRERQLAALRNELQGASAGLSQAQTEAAALREELSRAQAQAAASREELLSAQTEAAASRRELVTARSQYQACHAQLVELDAELEGASGEAASARQSLTQAIAARDALERALSARETELAETEAALTVVRKEAEQLHQAAADSADGLATQQPRNSVAMMTSGTMSAGLDVDQDGVSDSLDLCPETENGVVVGPTGCVLNASMTLEGVGFRYDSHELTDESHVILDRVAGILEQYPDLKLEVAGHADAQGDPAYNQWLSQQRAETVRKYLLTQGVKRDNLTARGYGAEQPVADNSTWEGLVRNRRVELRRLP